MQLKIFLKELFTVLECPSLSMTLIFIANDELYTVQNI